MLFHTLLPTRFLFALIAAVGPSTGGAQQVERVTPSYAVIGESTAFTAYGSFQNTVGGKRPRIEVALSPPAKCLGGVNPVSISASRLKFDCVISGKSGMTEMAITTKVRSRRPLVLWNGLVELLAAPPSVDTFVVEGVSNGVTSVSCHNAACRLVIGELVASQAFKVKFRGSNLPRTTHPAVDGCEFNAETTSPPDGWRHFSCNALPAGTHKVAIRSASNVQGGKALFFEGFDWSPAIARDGAAVTP